MTDPKITLNKVEYEIPKLVIKQNRYVEPLVFKHQDYFREVAKNGGTIKLLELTEQQAEDFTKIVYYALTRAKANITWEQFEQMPISMQDVMKALPVCLQQCGLFAQETEPAPPTGEE